MDEVVITIYGVKHWLWRVIDKNGMVLDVLVQSRSDTKAAKRLLRKLLNRQCRAPRVMVTDKLASYGGEASWTARARRYARRIGAGHSTSGHAGPLNRSSSA